jgi:hypothetical protein
MNTENLLYTPYESPEMVFTAKLLSLLVFSLLLSNYYMFRIIF